MPTGSLQPPLPDSIRSGRRQSGATVDSTRTVLPMYSPLGEPHTPTGRGGMEHDNGSEVGSHRSNLTGYSAGQLSHLRSPSYSTLAPLGHEVVADASDSASVRTVVASRNRPPRYSTIAPADGARESQLADQYPLTFQLRSGLKNRPWATLWIRDSRTIEGRRPRTLKVLGNETISGVLELDLESSQSITSIKINIKGKVITGFLDDHAFNIVDTAITIWDRTCGDPRHTTPGIAFGGKFSSGLYRFPFSFPFPTHVNASSLAAVDATASPTFSTEDSTHGHIITPFLGAQPDPPSTSTLPSKGDRSSFLRFLTRSDHPSALSTPSSPTLGVTPAAESSRAGSDTIHGNVAYSDVYPLPPTFLERGVNANTRYELTLYISHGKLRGDSRLRVPVHYTPFSQPPPSSLARASAYREGLPIPTPLLDPAGWFTLAPVWIAGSVEQRRVVLECTLSLAQPLSYARGTHVPCYMRLACDDQRALDLLAVPDALSVHLTRRVRFRSSLGGKSIKAGDASYMNVTPGQAMPLSLSDIMVASPHPSGNVAVKAPSEGEDLRSERTSVAIAAGSTWWIPPKASIQASTIRVLEGEIPLPPDLYPSSSFPAFSVEYSVEMLPFKSPPFLTDVELPEQSTVCSRQPVTIASSSRTDEPVAVPFAIRQSGSARTAIAHRGSESQEIEEYMANMAVCTSNWTPIE
ncbi:hypothetical protein CC1G_07732 [Coprinopsis cinerea okayama7|uniref:Arrestin-like N-terminal domain-containing protein n=1 Tax=Coprinopsis cinerea (strain Okayama-7 / 130 / ATCC MYA-4618 / FGSC 9003) TaxID=240176 RepID=A8NBY6_COPC7|nr:hypothetical protein CC1G_07732 [Coprinopsis cinerea okayama7\|eukprot:XP_001832345.2 hypothetical protein CC1G_07732 [Coprinopsis cinerea okayama7\